MNVEAGDLLTATAIAGHILGRAIAQAGLPFPIAANMHIELEQQGREAAVIPG